MSPYTYSKTERKKKSTRKEIIIENKLKGIELETKLDFENLYPLLDTNLKEISKGDKLSKENKDKIIFADRCVHDNEVYGMGFRELNWISQYELTHHENNVKSLFQSDDIPKNIPIMYF